MQLTIRILGLDLIDITITTDEPEDDSTSAPFGFAGSGTGFIETAADTMCDTVDRR